MVRSGRNLQRYQLKFEAHIYIGNERFDYICTNKKGLPTA